MTLRVDSRLRNGAVPGIPLFPPWTDTPLNKKNTLLFLLLSVLLVGGYALIPTGGKPAALAVPLLPPPVSKETLTLENAELRVTWRTQDAAIIQVEWREDGTRFLPDPIGDRKGPHASLGASPSGCFTGQPKVVRTSTGQDITFSGIGGEKLVYRLPREGHDLVLVSTTVPLALLTVPSDPIEARRLGRVFTLEAHGIHAVPMVDIVKEPFFAFLGARRKDLPPPTPWVGIDAGVVGTAGRDQAHFAAIWDVSPAPLPLPAGYELPEGGSGRLYLGPKHGPTLAAFGPPFPQVLDFGFFGPLGQVMFRALHMLHRVCPNWGWALVIFSVILRLALWPLNTKSILQGLRARDLDPHLKVIQAKHAKAGDTLAARGEQQKEVMAFYRKNGHNPMGGCLPSLVQMPVFLALYGMLGNVFELRHAPWLFWIRDLSGKDPFFVLPILLCVGMVVQQAMAPPVGDPAQRKLMMFVMPVMLFFMFATLPAGLNLYYLSFNLAGMAQTWWVTRSHRPQPVYT
jgi:YidC/Oxa1 family membrane protein insertase